MPELNATVPRLRQAVVAARDLDSVVEELRLELGLEAPFCDPDVGYFGLRNAVFALDGTFLEVVSPISGDAPASRLIERRGGDCGYMLMFQVSELQAYRDRAQETGVREVFSVDLPEMVEVHLHPADMRGAIVSLSAPQPADSWRWGGPQWQQRSAPSRLTGATVGLRDPRPVAERWRSILGEVPGLRFAADPVDRGLCEIHISARASREPVEIAGVRFVFAPEAR